MAGAHESTWAVNEFQSSRLRDVWQPKQRIPSDLLKEQLHGNDAQFRQTLVVRE